MAARTAAGGAPTAFRLDGKVAVVTGGGSGIGRAIATTLAGAGAAVVVADREPAWGAATCDAIAASGGAAAFCLADVGIRDDHEQMAALAEERFGGLDVLCVLGGPPAPFVEVAAVEDEQFDAVVATHVKSVMYGCRAAARRMERRGGGAILTMASTAADRPTAGNGLYTMAKTAVMALTRTMALELAPLGIRVNALAPGATPTNFSRRYYTDPDGTVDEDRRRRWLADMAALSPLGETGTPEDQAWLALYLVSPAGRFVTGQVVRANGGWSMP